MNLSLASSPQQTAAYLKTLPAIRERCTKVHDLAKKGQLQYFDYHPEKEEDAASFCLGIIQVGAYHHGTCTLILLRLTADC